MDDVINDILHDVTKPLDERAKAYASAVERQRFFQRPNQESKPDSSNNTDDYTPPLMNTIVQSVPKTFKSKAEALIQFLNDHAIKWTDTGELIGKDGTPVPRSNIVDLVNDLMRERKKVQPVGWDILSEELRRLNVPRELIGNEQRWLSMTSEGEKKKKSKRLRRQDDEKQLEQRLYGVRKWDKY